MMISNRLKNIIMLYCLGLLVVACILIFVFDPNDEDPSGQLAGEPSVTGTLVAEDPTDTPVPASPTPTEEPVRPEINLAGATEYWKEFADEICSGWDEISDRSSVLFKKPEAGGTDGVKAHIATADGNTVQIIIENCAYTEFYYSSFDRRVNGFYYSDEPPLGSSYAESDEKSEFVGTFDPNNIASDIYGDPMRKLGTTMIKDSAGNYTISIKIVLDREYEYSLLETESFYLLVLEDKQ